MVSARNNRIFLLFIIGLSIIHATLAISEDGKAYSKKLKVAVIGAGASGLCSAKLAIEQGHNVVIYEKTDVIGGVWWYTDEIGKDKYGINIHTPMYQGLVYASYESNNVQQIHDSLYFPSIDRMHLTKLWNFLTIHIQIIHHHL